MNSLVDLLVAYYNAATNKDAYSDIAKYILNHLNDASALSIKTIAEECYTSSTTINKFANIFQFKNFSHFKNELVTHIHIKRKQILDRINLMNIDDFYNIYAACAHNDRVLSKEDFFSKTKELARLFYERDKIVVYAAIYPYSLMTNLQVDLLMMNKQIVFYPTKEKNKPVSLNDNDLLFVITYSGRFLSFLQDQTNKVLGSSSHIAAITKESKYTQDYLSNCEAFFPLPFEKDALESNIILTVVCDMIRYFYYHDYYKG